MLYNSGRDFGPPSIGDECFDIDHNYFFYKVVKEVESEIGRQLSSTIFCTRGLTPKEAWRECDAFGDWWLPDGPDGEVFTPLGYAFIFDGERPGDREIKILDKWIEESKQNTEEMYLCSAAEQYVDAVLSQIREKKLVGIDSGLLYCDPSLCRWGSWDELFFECGDLLRQIFRITGADPGLNANVSYTSFDAGLDYVWYDTCDDKYMHEVVGLLPDGKLATDEKIAKHFYKEELFYFSQRHPYKLKRSFGSWDDILACMARAKGFDGVRGAQEYANLAKWDQEVGPVYCVSAAIAHEFRLADFNKSLLDSLFLQKEILPSALFVFEDDALPVWNDCRARFAVFCNASQSVSLTVYYGTLPNTLGPFPTKTNLSSRTVIIPRDSGSEEDRLLHRAKEKAILSRNACQELISWLDSVSNIVIQCAIAIQNEPSLVSGPDESQSTIGQAMKPSKGSKKVLRPRWLGKNYVRPAVRLSHGGTHLSPHPHWRKAHWRQQPCGPKGKERKLTLVRSVFVRGQSTQSD